MSHPNIPLSAGEVGMIDLTFDNSSNEEEESVPSLDGASGKYQPRGNLRNSPQSLSDGRALIPLAETPVLLPGFVFRQDFLPSFVDAPPLEHEMEHEANTEYLLHAALAVFRILVQGGDETAQRWKLENGGGTFWQYLSEGSPFHEHSTALLVHGFMLARERYMNLHADGDKPSNIKTLEPVVLEDVHRLHAVVDEWIKSVDWLVWPGVNYGSDEHNWFHEPDIIGTLIHHSHMKETPAVDYPGVTACARDIHKWLCWVSLTQPRVTDTAPGACSVFLKPISWRGIDHKKDWTNNWPAGGTRKRLIEEEADQFSYVSCFSEHVRQRLNPHGRWRKRLALGFFTPWSQLQDDRGLAIEPGPGIRLSAEFEADQNRTFITKFGYVVMARLYNVGGHNSGPRVQLALFDPSIQGIWGGKVVHKYPGLYELPSPMWLLNTLYTRLEHDGVSVSKTAYWGGKGVSTSSRITTSRSALATLMFQSSEFLQSVADGEVAFTNMANDLERNHSFSCVTLQRVPYADEAKMVAMMPYGDSW
ncbi:hypothetical protein MKZ38_009495 [Zalerion maritima]|uniref:Uncharacterized protein n=1 Tax=Zalerion maritima TaxID=339359 RepID=A0AAD5WV09_9PEZI|nr:hypothetical protein MKZ38_009495 [Zalerion maritima]